MKRDRVESPGKKNLPGMCFSHSLLSASLFPQNAVLWFPGPQDGSPDRFCLNARGVMPTA